MMASTALTYLSRLLLLCLVLGSILVQAASGKREFHMINGSGQKITSMFEGRAPNQYARDVLVRTIVRGGPDLSGLNRPRLGERLGRTLVAGPPMSSCPTGGICAQDGTQQSDAFVCVDNDGCSETVYNQGWSDNRCSGTFELYDCEQCCVSWVTCDTCAGLDPPAPPGPSPIIIDIEGQGFHLTSAVAGVSFDISGTGHPVQIAWTDPTYRNAFLALPGPDGLVHNGKELFGNFTPQPPSSQPNGFIALAEYDKPENGGNGDGIIDARDAVFSRLVLWIDENHDGISQPNELHRLPSLGVFSISLNYHVSWRQDEYGNLFRDRGSVNASMPQNNSSVGPSAYDVFLTTTPK